jgi:hypothetical protein
VQGEALARKIGAKQYLECSAKMSEGVRDVFDHASRAVALPRLGGKWLGWLFRYGFLRRNERRTKHGDFGTLR